jgi:hypothetical protein
VMSEPTTVIAARWRRAKLRTPTSSPATRLRDGDGDGEDDGPADSIKRVRALGYRTADRGYPTALGIRCILVESGARGVHTPLTPSSRPPDRHVGYLLDVDGLAKQPANVPRSQRRSNLQPVPKPRYSVESNRI